MLARTIGSWPGVAQTSNVAPMPRLRANRERNFDAVAIALRLRLGDNAAKARRALGLSQEVLAERLGCSVRYLQYVERGKANVTLDFLAALASTLEVDATALFVGDAT